MPTHPNRSAGHPARNPSPDEIRAARAAAGLTQAQAADLVYASARNWQQWEQEAGSNVRRMHPGLWELFRLKAQDFRLMTRHDGRTTNKERIMEEAVVSFSPTDVWVFEDGSRAEVAYSDATVLV